MKRADIKRRPLADTTLSSLEPETGAYRELDSPGLYFRVKPNGQKSCELRYKKPDGKWSWLGLGGYPEISGAFARQKAAELRADASEGKNPIISKKARQAAEIDAANDTFESLAREWHTSRLSGWDAGTAKRILGALERHVFPSLGKRPYTSIMSMEWMELLRGLERQGILEQMSRVRAYCKDIYDLARVTGRAVNNPLEGVHKFLSSGKAENYAHVSPDELPQLLRAIGVEQAIALTIHLDEKTCQALFGSANMLTSKPDGPGNIASASLQATPIGMTDCAQAASKQQNALPATELTV